jgi:hypothetical protein
MDAIVQGFVEIIPRHILKSYLDVRELSMFLAGEN